MRHYAIYGRSFFSRYDYEEVSSEGANKIVALLNDAITSSSLANKTYKSKGTNQDFTIASVTSFSYTDPIDGSVSKNQGQVVLFDDGSRVVFRLSGTGSQGATVRLYVERYVGPEAGEKVLAGDTAEGLKGLIEVALEISNLKEFLGREEPTVITVSASTKEHLSLLMTFSEVTIPYFFNANSRHLVPPIYVSRFPAIRYEVFSTFVYPK